MEKETTTSEPIDYSYLLKDTVLTEEQNRAISILTTRRSMILGFQAGLGKTTTCLTAAKVFNSRNGKVCSFFFFPKSARAAFKKEVENRLCEPYALYSTDEKVEYSGQSYVLCEVTYMKKIVPLVEQIAKDRPLACFFDEAHCLQDSKTETYRIFSLIRGKFGVFHAVTATPLINSMEGLFTLCQLVDPKTNSKWESFRSEYCITKTRKMKVKKNGRSFERRFIEIVGYKNLDKLKSYLSSICIQGSRNYTINFFYKQCDIDRLVMPKYIEASRGMFDAEDAKATDVKEAKSYGARIHDLQRIVDGAYSEEITNKTKLLLKALKAINLRKTEATLVYVEYDDSVDMLLKYIKEYADGISLNNVYVISGKTKESDRVEIERGIEPRDVVIITAAGSQSRNLQRANNLIFYDLPFSVGRITQCVGRICRVDTKYAEQNVCILEVNQTIDTYKRILFKDNLWLIRQLFSGQTTMPTDVMSVDEKAVNEMKQRFLWCRSPRT